MSVSETADVVICGGAAIGSSVAHHLAADPGFTGKVVVIEKDPTYRYSASALSAASIRQQFSSAVNIRISLFGIDFLRSIGTHLAVDGEVPAIDLHEGGYLYLAGEAGKGILEANQKLQQQEGADIALYAADMLRSKFPWLNTSDLACGTFGVSGEGWFDGWALLQAFRKKARSLGIEYRQGEVARYLTENSRVTGVELADGSRIAWRSARPVEPDIPFLVADVTPRHLRVPEGAPRIHRNGVTGIAAVTVAVKDLAASTARYRALLGQEPVAAGTVPGLGFGLVQFRIGEQVLSIVAAREEGAGPAHALAARGQGICALSFFGSADAVLEPRLSHGAPLEIVGPLRS